MLLKTTRLVAVLVMSAMTFLAMTAAADAAPKLTPEQVRYANCVAKETVLLVKAVDKQVWKDRAARDAALRAAVDQAKKSCTRQTPQRYTVPITGTARGASVSRIVECSAGDRAISGVIDPNPFIDPGGTEFRAVPGRPEAFELLLATNPDDSRPDGLFTYTGTLTCERGSA